MGHSLGFELQKPAVPVTNLEFLQTLFSNLPDDECAWVCAFSGDPGTVGGGSWRGWPLRPGDPLAEHALRGTELQNSFCCFSSFRGDPSPGGAGTWVFPGRLGGRFAALHAMMLDDIGVGPGAKISPERIKLEPSWINETSPGNWQVGYRLMFPCADGARANAAIDALVHIGLGAEKDPGMKGLTRYGRLPQGFNGKPQYRTLAGDMPEHRILHWRPELCYLLEEVLEAYGITEEDLSAAGGLYAADGSGLSRSADDDPLLEVIGQAVGEIRGRTDKGSDGIWWDILCPWYEEHTDGVTGSAFKEGDVDAEGHRRRRGFQCHHGHCIDRTYDDLERFLLGHEDEAVRRAAGKVLIEDALVNWAGPRDPAPPLDVIPPWIPERTVWERVERLLPYVEGDAAAAAEIDSIMSAALREGMSPLDESRFLDLVRDKTGVSKPDVTKMWKAVKEQAAQKMREEEIVRRMAQEAVLAGTGAVKLPVLSGGWRDVDENGAPRATSRNVECILQAAEAGARLNLMRDQIEYTGYFERMRMTGDRVHRFLADAATINGVKGLSPADIVSCLRAVSWDERYHPFELFLDGLKGQWDGTDRLRSQDGLYNTLDVDHGDLDTRNLILDRWLRSVVAAAKHLYAGRSGWQPRGVLVFMGEQYGGKTTWLSRLFEGLFPGSCSCFIAGAHFDGSTDARLNITGSLVAELGEIDSTLNRSEVGQLKAFLSNDVDRLRRPYGYEHEDRPRRTVFAGTVNHQEFLRDQTGSTRFWCVRTKKISLDAQRKLDLRQIWAQVLAETTEGLRECLAARRKGAYQPLPWHLSDAEMRLVEASNEVHRERSLAELKLLDKFDWSDADWQRAQTLDTRMKVNPMTITDVIEALGPGLNARSASELHAALRRLTGQVKAAKTSVRMDGHDGSVVVKNGRFWAMPPFKILGFDLQPGDPEGPMH